jgi:hypothetical protein
MLIGAKNKVAVDLYLKGHGEIDYSRPSDVAKNKVAVEPSPQQTPIKLLGITIFKQFFSLDIGGHFSQSLNIPFGLQL